MNSVIAGHSVISSEEPSPYDNDGGLPMYTQWIVVHRFSISLYDAKYKVILEFK